LDDIGSNLLHAKYPSRGREISKKDGQPQWKEFPDRQSSAGENNLKNLRKIAPENVLHYRGQAYQVSGKKSTLIKKKCFTRL